MQGSVAHGGDTLEDLAGTYDGVHACVVTFVCVHVTHNTRTPTHATAQLKRIFPSTPTPCCSGLLIKQINSSDFLQQNLATGQSLFEIAALQQAHGGGGDDLQEIEAAAAGGGGGDTLEDLARQLVLQLRAGGKGVIESGMTIICDMTHSWDTTHLHETRRRSRASYVT